MIGNRLSFTFCFVIFLCYSCTAKDLGKDLERLQTKFDDLKAKDENVIHQLQVQNAELVHQVEYLKDRAASKPIRRTCHEYLENDPSAPSGEYIIDPDGNGIGESDFQVYCDMSNGVTMISHDSENSINVTKCPDPGCYSRTVVYDANQNQIKALKHLSTNCRQRVQYDCIAAPFYFNGIDYSWWNDVNGNKRYYWSGDNNTIHTCECGISKTCADNYASCNCDALLPEVQRDEGYVTNKDDLPIMQLNFGRTSPTNARGVHTLGKLECYGKLSFQGDPTSCQDLWEIGYTLNGYYTVKKNNIFQLVFCDMSKLFTTDMEILQGIISVNYPQGIYFDAYNTKPTTGPTKITYDQVAAQGCQLANGNFQANQQGFYSFSFLAYSSAADTKVDMVVNGNRPIGSSMITGSASYTLSINAIAYLNVNDTVATLLIGSLGFGNSAYTHFSGALLQNVNASMWLKEQS